MKEDKQLFIGWVHQFNEPVYTPLKITDRDKETVRLSSEINDVTFVVITIQKPNNINNLILTIMTESILVFLFWEN